MGREKFRSAFGVSIIAVCSAMTPAMPASAQEADEGLKDRTEIVARWEAAEPETTTTKKRTNRKAKP